MPFRCDPFLHLRKKTPHFLLEFQFGSRTVYRSRVIGVNTTSRSSRLEVFCRKKVPSNFVKRPGKHLCQSHFLNKAAGLRSATLLKKRLWHRCFRVCFAKFLRKSFLTEHFPWLLLNVKASKLTIFELSVNKF